MSFLNNIKDWYKPMKKILLTSYFLAVHPSKEGYAALKIVEQIARHQEVVLLTRIGYQEAIETYWQENDFRAKANLQVFYYGGKNKLMNANVWAYYRWQWGVVDFIKKKKIDFDIAQDINCSSLQVPTFLWRLQKPLVWSPAALQPTYPAEYIKRSYGSLHYAKKRMAWMMRRLVWRADPLLKKAKEKSTRIIVADPAVGKEMNLPKAKLMVMPAFATAAPNDDSSIRTGGFEILSKGDFTVSNGFDLTIKSFARFYKALPGKQQQQTRLILLGAGPEEARLKALIAAKGLGKAIRIIHCLKPAQEEELYRHAAMFLFPSHAGGSRAIPRALAYGLPILCLDNAVGTHVEENCGRKVAYGQYEHTVDHLTTHLHQLFMDKSLYQELSAGARAQFQQYFTWDRKGELLRRLYAELLKEQVAKPICTS